MTLAPGRPMGGDAVTLWATKCSGIPTTTDAYQQFREAPQWLTGTFEPGSGYKLCAISVNLSYHPPRLFVFIPFSHAKV